MDGENKFTRVDAKILISFKLLNANEAAQTQSSIEGSEIENLEFIIPPSVADPVLKQWLEMFNAKLDILLTSAKGKQRSPDSQQIKTRPVNLSAAGAIFPVDSEFSKGDIGKVRMILPLKRQLTLVMMAKVVKFSDPILTVKFINVSEDIRSKISDYVFFREREIIMAERI